MFKKTLAERLGDATTIGILGRAFWTGAAAIAAVAVTAFLSFEANRWEEAAVLDVRARTRLARDASVLVLTRADGARGYLVTRDSDAIRMDRSLRVALAATLDSLEAVSASNLDERAAIADLRTEISQWDTTFVHAAFASHSTPAVPRLLLGASAYLIANVQEKLASLRAIQDRSFGLALRRDDLLRRSPSSPFCWRCR